MSTQQTAADRELLELAAQAYWAKEIADGEISFRYDEAEAAIVYIHADNQDHNGEDRERVWNTRKSWHDAMSLASRLGMSVEPYPYYSMPKHSVIVKQRRRCDQLREHNPTEVVELYGDDAADATRLAITRCAAAIARATTQQDQA